MSESLGNFYVIVAEPKFGGNVGAIARVMANFGFKNLILFNPCDLDDECYSRAKHAFSLIDEAKIFDSFEDAISDMDYLVATSSISYSSDKKHLRNPIYLEDFSERLLEIKGKIGLVFGREDYGLYNHEIAKCDVMVRIPSSEEYPTL
ncbi:MAG: TrmH family RNA methyltransferase, partial [Candidatus Thermoplasmatota archaeon]